MAADAAVARGRHQVDRLQRHVTSLQVAMEELLEAASELADKRICIIPALRSMPREEVPAGEVKLRRNVAAHSSAKGPRLPTASIGRLRSAQKGRRLEGEKQYDTHHEQMDNEGPTCWPKTVLVVTGVASNLLSFARLRMLTGTMVKAPNLAQINVAIMMVYVVSLRLRLLRLTIMSRPGGATPPSWNAAQP